MLQELSVDTLIALNGSEFRKLHFHVMRSDMIEYMIIRWSMSEDTFGGEHALLR